MINSNTINKILAIEVDTWSERIALQMFSSGNLCPYTYAQLVKDFKTGAERIKKARVKAGDRVVLISENRPEWVMAYLAALEAQTTVVLIDPKLASGDLSQLIDKSDPRLLILSPCVWEKLPSKGTRGLPVLNLEDQLIPFEGTPTQVPPDLPPTYDPDPEVASILFTSGTSGFPKGVLVTHQSLLHCAQSGLDLIKINSSNKPQRCLCILPLHHMAGLTGLLIAPLLVGATITFVESVDKENILASLTNTKSTVLTAVPRFYDLIYRGIINQIEKKGRLAQAIIWSLGSFSYWIRSFTPWNIGSLLFPSIHQAFGGELKYCLCGGATLASEVKLGMEKLGFTILEGYGLTESGVCVYNTLDESRIGHVGKPCQGIEIRIDQPERTTGEGEICIRGISLMKGYFRDAEATAAVLRDGWLYTGDLGRLDPQGNLVITGRIKEVIVTAGGKKAAPTVVEEYYRGLTGVKEFAVFGMPARDGLGESVHGALVLEPVAIQPEVNAQDALEKVWKEIEARSVQVPIYLRIQKIHLVEELPKTTTLKVKRKELQKLINDKLTSERKKTNLERSGFRGEKVMLDRETLLGLPQEKQVERVKTYLLDVVSNVLQIDLPPSDMDESLLALGIDSVNATELVNKLRSELGWEIPLEQLLNGSNIEELAASWKDHNTSQSRNDLPLSSISREDNLPLSFAQERLWFLNQLEGASATYNIPGVVRITGNLDLNALQQAFSEIVRRHEVLRTSFPTVNGTPIQLIHPEATMKINVMDLQPLEATERETVLEQQTQLEAITPFDLEIAPLIRCSLWHLDAREYLLLLTMHHIISDGWSIGVFIQELSSLYQAFSRGEPSPLAELPIQYADFALWQKQRLSGELLETQLHYWLSQLEGAPELLQLPTDRPRPSVQTYRGATKHFTLNTDLSQKLQTLSRNLGTTLFMTLQATFATLLYRYSGQSDILIGSPIANRNRSEIESLIGFFVNTLVLRTSFEDNPSFEKLLARVRKTTLKAYEYEDVPFEKVVEALQPQRSLSHSPLFQVMFVLQNSPIGELKLPGVTLSELHQEGTVARFDLTLSITETEQGLVESWEYNTDLFDGSTIERMAAHFQNLLSAIMENPQVSVGELPLLSEAERYQLLVEWNETAKEYPQDQCIHKLFEDQVERTPLSVAVVFENQQLTYQQLNQRANQLAHQLLSLGVGSEVLVGICVEHSLEMVVGLLGILKAGGAYVPLDPNYPPERLSYMLADSGVEVLLTQRSLLESLPSHTAGVVCLDRDWEAIEQLSQENLITGVGSDNLAYVIYTSGSTGKPKGVAIEHKQLMHYLYGILEKLNLNEGTSWALVSSFAADLGHTVIFPSLSTGGCLHLISKERASNSHSLAEYFEQHPIDCLKITPLHLEALMSFPHPERIIPNQRLVLGGEASNWKLVEKIASIAPHCLILNHYGPTETTVGVITYQVGREGGGEHYSLNLPLGRPLSNRKIYILNRYLQTVPVGIPGELYIGGAGLARGYLNRPELTAEKFIGDPFSKSPRARLYKTGDLARYLPDGNIEFLGRIDNQVKIRGFRIELGEIEATLHTHSQIQQAVVIAREDIPGNKRLVAYVVTSDKSLSNKQLREFLFSKLPEYMVPSALVTLEALPLKPNGKVDRKALPAPDEEITREQEYVVPRTPSEEIIANIFANILGVPKVGIHDNFFELGGHSLLAVRLMSQIRQHFQISLPLSTLFQSPTIEQLASLLRCSVNTSHSILVPIKTNRNQPPLFCIHPVGGNVLCYEDLALHLGRDYPVYGLQSLGLDGQQQPLTSIEEMASHYIEAIQQIQSKGPYQLIGWSMGGVIAYEIAQQLQAKNDPVALLALIDSYAPSVIPLPSEIDEAMIVNQLAQDWGGLYGQKLDISLERLRKLKPEKQVEHLFEQAKQQAIFPPEIEIEQMLSLWKVFKANLTAKYHYQPQAYSGSMLLLNASETSPPEGIEDPTHGWGSLVLGAIKMHTITGNHYTIIQAPQVEGLSEKLNNYLIVSVV